MSATNQAPHPAHGTYADGFGHVARVFAAQLRDGRELGGAFTAFHRGVCVVDLWGGLADPVRRVPWARDTRALVFSVTKGLVAMAATLLADRGRFDWDAPVATYWPEFGAAGKEAITVRALFNHRAALLALDEPLTLDDCLNPASKPRVLRALERQRPLWEPGGQQGYHAVTYGMYAQALIERIAGTTVGELLRRELFEPLGADVSLGTPAAFDARMAKIHAPTYVERIGNMLLSSLLGPSTELRIAREVFSRDSLQRRAFQNPKGSPATYDVARVHRAELAWASATASAHGLARAYLPFASGGSVDGRVYLRPQALTPLHARQSWSERDRILQKPLGWSQGFLKEETALFCPNPESFGHAGMGGALGWCDPVTGVALGYVMNRMDWRVRSPRALSLCRTLFSCDPLR